jgi:CBS domain-containing protein
MLGPPCRFARAKEPQDVLAAAQQDVPLVLTGFLFGILVLVAIAGGSVAHALRAPRVIGYLAGGAIAKIAYDLVHAIPDGPLATFDLAPTERPLSAVVDLALGLILFSIGAVFEAKHFRSVSRFIGKLALAEAATTMLLVFLGVLGAVFVVRGFIPDDVRPSVGVAIGFSILLACGGIATAPAATLFVLREYDAKGPVTDAILSLTGINNVVCIALFQIAFVVMAASGMLGEGATALSGLTIWEELIVNLGGSLALGIAIGVIMGIVHARLRPAETYLVLVGIVLALAGLEDLLLASFAISHNVLLTSLFAGAFFANIAIAPEKLETFIFSVGRPIFIGFFAIAGFRLHIDDLPAMGLVGIAYVVFRTVGKVVGVALGVRWTGLRAELRENMGAAMLCQAAVVIGLAQFVRNTWTDPWASRNFSTVILGSVVLFELIGPLLTKLVVSRAGEVKAVTLLRRADGATSSIGSAVRITLGALLRPIAGRPSDALADEDLRVRHVMRTNVKTLSASAGFDEVLHFIERSRDSDFPVVDDHNTLVGLIRFHEIRKIIYNPALRDLVTAADLVGADPPMVTADTPLDDILALYRTTLTSALPVVESLDTPRVIGAVDQRDVLRAMHTSPKPT